MISSTPVGDQVYVNRTFHDIKRSGHIKEKFLSEDLFPVGRIFFKDGLRMFIGDNPCEKCVIVHNNYIVSVEGKRYRFKEYGLWAVDEDGYYSNKDRKYIQFDNPIDFRKEWKNDIRAMELKSLRFSLILGHILNRTVILPSFRCAGGTTYIPHSPEQKCHFGLHYCVRKFESVLPMITTYREHVFLKHELVPESTKTSKTQAFVIDSSIWQTYRQYRSTVQDLANVIVLAPGSLSGVTVAEIRKWFSGESRNVLVFHSLYNTIINPDRQIQTFVKKLDTAIKVSNFMQTKQ
jgi:hypothetical protein